jgi:hypothetical protein
MRSKGDSFRSRTDSARSRQHSPHSLPQVLEADSITEEHGESDLEKEEMDDDGHRPLTEISKRSTVMKRPHDVDGFRGVCLYPEQQIVGRATILAGWTVKLETCTFESDSTTFTTATHLLGGHRLVPRRLLQEAGLYILLRR